MNGKSFEVSEYLYYNIYSRFLYGELPEQILQSARCKESINYVLTVNNVMSFQFFNNMSTPCKICFPFGKKKQSYYLFQNTFFSFTVRFYCYK